MSFYNPSNYISYTLNTTTAQATSLSTLSWGVQYRNSSLNAGSFSGSLRARLWAVKTPYTGGSISGTVLGVFNPNFTGSGAKSANQILVGGYSTTSVQSSSQETNPSTGGYCLVATLEQYSGACSSTDGYCISDWTQFSGAVVFK